MHLIGFIIRSLSSVYFVLFILSCEKDLILYPYIFFFEGVGGVNGGD